MLTAAEKCRRRRRHRRRRCCRRCCRRRCRRRRHFIDSLRRKNYDIVLNCCCFDPS